MPRLVLISDTHNRHKKMAPLPDGDILIHAGDMTGRGELHEVRGFFTWFGAQPHRHKIVIAGNHDFAFERQPAEAEALVPASVAYLRDSGTVVEGLRIWGSPWQPWFLDWAFNLGRGPALAERWALIPDDTQLLVTHGPPHGVLDQTVAGERVGCEDLALRIAQLPDLRLHLFGHIHEGYGETERGGVRYVNASVCDVAYEPRNLAVVVEV